MRFKIRIGKIEYCSIELPNNRPLWVYAHKKWTALNKRAKAMDKRRRRKDDK